MASRSSGRDIRLNLQDPEQLREYVAAMVNEALASGMAQTPRHNEPVQLTLTVTEEEGFCFTVNVEDYAGQLNPDGRPWEEWALQWMAALNDVLTMVPYQPPLIPFRGASATDRRYVFIAPLGIPPN